MNPGPLGPEPSALPTALHPVSLSIIRFFGPNVKMHFAVRVHILQCGYTVFRCGYALFDKNPKKIRPSPYVGLSNILDSELIRREPAEGSHGQVVGAAVMDGKLLGKVVE